MTCWRHSREVEAGPLSLGYLEQVGSRNTLYRFPGWGGGGLGGLCICIQAFPEVPGPASWTLLCLKPWQPLWAQIRHPGTGPARGLTPSIPLMPASTVLGHIPEAPPSAE